MKYLKIAMSASLLSAFILAGNAFAEPKLTCNDVYGTWTGNLGNLTQARFYIHPNDGMEDVDVSFKDSSGMSIEYGLLTGGCQENADGSITANYNRNKWGASITLKARLTQYNQLTVTEFSYSDYMNNGSGTGVLTK